MSYLVPMVIEKTAQGERAMDIQSRMLRDRIIMLNDAVTQHTAGLIVAQMLYLESEDREADILFYINSPGGSVSDGLAILDTMQFVKCDVSTIVMGAAYSMGSLLAQAGTPGKRLMLPNSRHMCHQPSGGAQGMASDIQIQANEILKLKKLLTDVYVQHNSRGKTYEDFAKIMDRDTYLSAQESVDFGLADRIVVRR
jgi:ATP-dependent Clp protease, protease subunit